MRTLAIVPRLPTILSIVLSLGWTLVASAAPFAYITNQGSGTVSVIDTTTNAVIATVPVGPCPVSCDPFGVAVHPDGTRVYVTDFLARKVWVIDTSTNRVIVSVGASAGASLNDITQLSGPQSIAINPSGTRIYVTNVVGGFVGNTVSVIDTATNTAIATVPVGSGPIAFGQFIGPGQTVVPAFPALTLSLNQATFRTGGTLRVGLKAQNPGPAFQTDFYFGVLLPDGITLFFFTGLSPINGVVTRLDANPKTFQALVINILIPQGLDVTLDDILVLTFAANFPPGTYIFFALLTPPGVFTDGRVDTGDILVIDAKSLSFGP